MNELIFYNYDKTKSYNLFLNEESDLVLTDEHCDYFKKKSENFYDFLLKFFKFESKYEYQIKDINQLIISGSCELMFRVDVNKNIVLGSFYARIDNLLFIMIDENMNIYITEHKPRLIYSYNGITEKIFNKVLDICIKIFGENLCKKSALTYAQRTPVFERYEKHGIVTITGEFFRGEKRPPGSFKNKFLNEQKFNFDNKPIYNLSSIPIDYIYDRLSFKYKESFESLYFVMQPSGQWWITNCMLFSDRDNRWLNFDGILFSPFDMFHIHPVDDFKKKYYLIDIKTFENHNLK